MVLNAVELRAMAINIAKELTKNVDTLIEEAQKIEKYIQGDATIPNVVEDPSKVWIKAFEGMQKNLQPFPPLPEIKVKKAKKKNKE